MDICILLSTCDKYIKLAELTVVLIDQRWKDHPPIFVCGLSSPCGGNAETLTLHNDSQDWIGIARSAAQQLLEKGYQKCYLILDDHPPIKICNETHLNINLPTLMDSLHATYIGLHGWDQNTLSDGRILGCNYYFLQHQADSFLWQYALHPALWNIQAFFNMTDLLDETGNDIKSRSIWAFERRSGAVPSLFPFNMQGRSYRIFGLVMLGGKFRLIRALSRRFFYFSINLRSLIIKKLLGVDAQQKFIDQIIHETLFFDGPYPLYWSGVMQKGSLNKNFQRFLITHKQDDELSRFQEVIS